MINLLLIAYFIFLLFFFGGSLAVVYHLKVNKLNEKVSTITTLFFIVGCLLVLTFNISNAIQVDWKLLSFDLGEIPVSLELEDSSYE
ncbi:hypothetical protein HN784_00935 [bacterium]|jgi:hypothetical protein|nr:hypothetical protein [bacterium]MBT4251641.1 hypothetical protein [bacterium]MBT4597690.1 hypothetical protein [bacterium]MBT6753703.1 hypothetical protein [bacterium]MBT7037840.1 hypothetical protein [bacterium]